MNNNENMEYLKNLQKEGVKIPVQIIEHKEEAKHEETNQNDSPAKELNETKENQESSDSKPPLQNEQDKDKKIKELEEQTRRLSAEFENFRRRQEKRLDEIRKYAAEEVITKFLPVLDSIQKAKEAASSENSQHPLYSGIQMIEKQLAETLKNLGVEEISAVGSPFDPSMHQALSAEETDQHPDETVIEEYQMGYIYKDRVLRPSMVKVSRLPGSLTGN